MGQLAAVVDEAIAVDPRGLPGPALAERIVELRRQINRLESAYLASLEAFDRTGAALADHGSTQAFLRTECHLAPGRAGRDVHLSRDLADALPTTCAALADGRIGVDHAQLIASLRPMISPEALTDSEPHLIDYASRATPQELRKVVTHVKHSYAPDRLREDEADDYDHRSLHASTILDGVGVGNWTLHPVGHETVMTAIHAASRPVTDDDRTPAQRRADALITIAEIALKSGELPITGGVKPHVSVIVPWKTLAAQPGAPAADYGFGATSSGEWARRVACDAEVARIVTGPAGEILDSGRASRCFTAAQTRAIVARDRTCVWPGCDTPPGWCDCHHRIHWADGGSTSVDNGVLICGRHHDRIHQHGHAVVDAATGGRTVDVRPGTDPRWQAPRHRAGP